jgi:UDP-N-acetylglucosamine 2-epimerase (non-hydrolysing)
MPEEINRVVTDHVSDLLFCPTETAALNLFREGLTTSVYNVGDVMLDALEYNLKFAEEKSTILEDFGLSSKEYMIATVHRASNTDSFENLSSIVNALCDSGSPFVFPVHPRTEMYLKRYGLWDKLREKVILISPVGYLEMLKLMAHSKKILTDSGGVQKEAYMLGVPCITMRENTEWIETVDDGWNVLVGADYEKILDSISNFEVTKTRGYIFGHGDTAARICELLKTINISRGPSPVL